MESIMKMAGEFTSHAIWSVSSGEVLIPILGYLKSDNTQSMQRLAMGSVEAISYGEQSISNLDKDTLGAAFIKDGIVTLDTGKTDALIVDITFAEDSNKKVQFILPYRNANHTDGFAVHRLQLSALDGIAKETSESLIDAFFDGIEAHTQGGKIWNENYVDKPGVSTGHYGEECTEFSQSDFDALKQSPFLIFFLVAAADGNVDKKEVAALQKLLSDSDNFKNRLLNRIITNVITDIPNIILSMMQKEMNYIEELDKLKNIIDTNLSPTEANEFKIALFMVGKQIAEASGGFLGFGSKISKEEKGALAAIAVCLGITPT